MKSRNQYTIWGVGALIGLLLIGWLGAYLYASGDNLYAGIKLLDRVAFEVSQNYVEEVNPKDLIYAGIRGMLNILDPHTQFFEQRQYEELMIGTQGKYGGVGMVIGLRERVLTVISPFEGGPAYKAGIQAGDMVIEIEGKSTKGITTQEAATKLRGPKGTKVSLTVKREGVDEPLEFSLTRDIIKIKSVPYAGIVANGVGYVRLSRFSENAEEEIRGALNRVGKEAQKGLILDLRNNPGGLLSQAVDVSDLFLPKEKLVVYTKGRLKGQNRQFYSKFAPLYGDKPLIILVNGGSASASEIISGAVQDWDRGLILGTRTFGKGSVQTVLKPGLGTPFEGTALKITTAKWYIPSGRCIQKEERAEEDTTKEDTTKEEQKEIFKTQGGRTVYGGGGVTPDVILELPKLNRLELELSRKGIFFDFAIDYTSKHKHLKRGFEVTDQMLAEFKDFLREKDFHYTSKAESQLEDLEKSLREIEYNSHTEKVIGELRSNVLAAKEKEFDNSLDYIKMGIKREIVSKLWGEEAVYEELVEKSDKQVQRAVEILETPGEYKKLLGM